MLVRFTEVNPDKGTETIIITSVIKDSVGDSLQKLTPIRGRKPIGNAPGRKHSKVFTEVNPDKGTETIIIIVIIIAVARVYRS